MILSTHGEHHWNNSIQNIGYSGYNQTDLLVKKHVWGGLVSFTYQWFIWGVHSIDQPTNWKSYDCKGHRQNDVENQWIQRHQHPKYKGNMGEEASFAIFHHNFWLQIANSRSPIPMSVCILQGFLYLIRMLSGRRGT